MKVEPMLEEIETIKAGLADGAGGDSRRFLEQMDAWLDAHPHAGPVVNSPEELQARVRLREANEPPPEPGEPYRIYDPIIAEIHRIRADLSRERDCASPILREDPPKPGG